MSVQINIPQSELQKRKLFLATPQYGGVCSGVFARSVADLAVLCAHYKVHLQIYFLFNESLITRARNYCCDEFLRSDCTHLMFIDSDIGFNPRDVIGMLALAGDDSPYDVITGAYPKKTISWEKIKHAVNKGFADENPNNLERFVGDYVFNPKQSTTSIPINQPTEVMEAGTGFMMIRRKTFEEFNKHYPYTKYKPDHVRTEQFDGSREITQFFQAEIDADFPTIFYQDLLQKIQENKTDLDKINKLVEDGQKKIAERALTNSKRYLSEDYWFCQKIQEIGLKVWMCPWIQLQHCGTYVFGGSLADIAALGVSPTADIEALKATKNKAVTNKPKMIEKKVTNNDKVA